MNGKQRLREEVSWLGDVLKAAGGNEGIEG